MRKRALQQGVAIVGLGLLVVAAIPAGLGAQQAEEPGPGWAPVVYPDETITLIDAVRLTLEQSPNIRLEEEAARLRRGALQEASGEFDSSLTGYLSYNYERTELTEDVKRQEEQTRFDILDDIYDADEGILARLDETQQILDGIHQVQAGVAGARVEGDPDLQANVDMFATLIAEAEREGRGADAAELTAGLSEFLAIQEQNYAQNLEVVQWELQGAQTDLENLGAVPEDEEQWQGEINLQLLFPFRSGVSLGPFLNYKGSSDKYRGKPVNANCREEVDLDGDGLLGEVGPDAAAGPEYTFHRCGGMGIPDIYRTTIGFTLDAPLLRGRGAASTAATERAAEAAYEASLASLRHTTASSVLSTVLAYWSAVGAEATVGILGESAKIQSRLVELTQSLIDADELPGAELARVRAREAEILGFLDDANRRAHEARVALARTIGLRVEQEAQTPRPANGFPAAPGAEVLTDTNLSSMVAEASDRRDDFQAAVSLMESGGILARAAEIDLKPSLDAGTKLWYNNIGTDGSAAFDGKWVGPSFNVVLDLEWPFANNTQEGLNDQAQANYQSLGISATDLRRVIRSSVVQVYGSLRETVAQLGYAEEATQRYRESLEAEMERFRFGGSTLIDTLLTEQRLTDARLSEVAVKQQYAQLLAKLRFETGTLIAQAETGSVVRESDLLSLPILSESGGQS